MVKQRRSRATNRRSNLKRTARRSAKRTARRSAKRTARRSAGKVDAVSDILSAAYGIERRKRSPKPPPIPRNIRGKKVPSNQSGMDSFLAGIESSSGPYNLGDIFKGDEKGNRVAQRGPLVKNESKSAKKTGKARKGRKTNPGRKVEKKRKSRRGTKRPSEWILHVKKFYAEKKKGNKDYKYKDALKDAKKTYNK